MREMCSQTLPSACPVCGCQAMGLAPGGAWDLAEFPSLISSLFLTQVTVDMRVSSGCKGVFQLSGYILVGKQKSFRVIVRIEILYINSGARQ